MRRPAKPWPACSILSWKTTAPRPFSSRARCKSWWSACSKARRLLLDGSARQSGHRLSHVAEYIKQHLREPLSIDQLASQACMSKPSFFRCFKSEFGLTALEYIQQERIRVAKDLLLDPRHTLAEVCALAGFQDMSHFIRIVKRLTGATPGELKRRLVGGV